MHRAGWAGDSVPSGRPQSRPGLDGPVLEDAISDPPGKGDPGGPQEMAPRPSPLPRVEQAARARPRGGSEEAPGR
jgi:hypothetical protein